MLVQRSHLLVIVKFVIVKYFNFHRPEKSPVMWPVLLKIIFSSILFPRTYTHLTEIFDAPSLEKGFSHTAVLKFRGEKRWFSPLSECVVGWGDTSSAENMVCMGRDWSLWMCKIDF